MRTMTTPIWNVRSLNSEMNDIFSEMERFVDEFNRYVPEKNFYDERAFLPACEVSETEDHFLMSLDIPGMKKENIKIEISNNLLTISGERKREKEINDQGKIQRLEKAYGFFKRSFTLPVSVDETKVEALYEDGVLELYLPKVETAKPRQIEVQAGKRGFFERILGDKKSEVEDSGVE